MTKPKIILASASIGRKMLLEKLGVPFEVIPSTIDEEKIIDPDPLTMIQKRAKTKAENVVHRVTPLMCAQHSSDGETSIQNHLIIAADSAAICYSKVFGKPRDKNHAFEIIKALSGKTHMLATSLVIHQIDKKAKLSKAKLSFRLIHSSVTKTHVTIRKLTDQEIHQYVNTYDLRRFAASYALNETPWDLITKIDGSYTNVIGLPSEQLLPILRKLRVL